MAKGLTDKQRAVLDFIKNYTKENGFPPTVREMCAGINVSSTSTIHGYLDRLEKGGYIEKDSANSRSIRIIDPEFTQEIVPATNIASIPVIGQVTAGEPILAQENIEDHFPIPSNMISSGKHFLLKVSGESMIEAGIMDRDYILVRQQSDARNGDIVVALLDDSATVKTFYKEKDHIRLQPENASLSPIISRDVQVIGIVKGVFRFM